MSDTVWDVKSKKSSESSVKLHVLKNRPGIPGGEKLRYVGAGTMMFFIKDIIRAEVDKIEEEKKDR